jgi:two-component system NtrC family sensor kinase
MSTSNTDEPAYHMGRAETGRLRQLEQAYLARPRVSIRMRLVAGFLFCFFLLALTGLVNLVILYQARSQLHFLDVSQTLSLQIQRASHFARLDFPNQTYLETAAASARSAFDLFLQDSAQVMGATDEASLSRLNYQMGHYVQLLDDGLALAKTRSVSTEQAQTLDAQIEMAGTNLLDLLRTLKARQAAAADRVLSLSQKLPFVFAGVMLLIIFWIAGLLAGTVTDSLRRLEESTRRIAAGDYTLMNPKRRYHDEFSDLSLAVNRMLLELRARDLQVMKADRLAGVGMVASGFARQLSASFDTITKHVDTFLGDCPAARECEQCGLVDAVSGEALRGKESVASLLEFIVEDESVLSPVDLRHVVESSRRLLEGQMAQAHVTFANEIPPDMPSVRAAPNQLRHVFLNLFQNAIQAMPRGGALTVRAALLAGGQASVSVSDQGDGIPPDALTHIFDPSFTTKGIAKGTGLGLAISYGLVKRHGGDIYAESLVGRGTTVHITLPLSG